MSDADLCRKVFVLDTNVILHDANCIHSFQEHDIVIPITGSWQRLCGKWTCIRLGT
jgi:hypothetical protein